MQLATIVESQLSQSTQRPWSLISRIALRFCASYFGLYCLGNQIIGSVFTIPKISQPDWATLWPVRPFIFWIGSHLFGMQTPLVYSDSGSGDKHFDWVLVFCTLVFACLATALWSLLDRRPRDYSALHKWFWLFLRICLGSQMFAYGFVKAIPLQMTSPSLFTLTEPFGNLSPMGVLWSSVGAAPAYETFTGCAEILAGTLLIFSRTVTLGALIALADMTMVFMLNMTYDVPVKLLSFHLILVSLLLLSPDFPRLLDFFLLGRPASVPKCEPLFAIRRPRRIASSVVAFLWLWMIANNLYGAWNGWHQYGPGAAHSLLYGIWNIESGSFDEKPLSLTVTDLQAWRRLTFDYPEYLFVQHMDDSRKSYALTIDPQHNTLILTDPRDKNWKASFTFARVASDRLTLHGSIAGHKSTLELHRQDEKKFELVSRGFHWIQDYPYNR